MDPVVTARVPAGVRARGTDVLREIGATTSELINAAFDYVIQEHELPRPRRKTADETHRRTLDEGQLEQLASFMDAVKIATPDAWKDEPFESLLEQASEERYADLC